MRTPRTLLLASLLPALLLTSVQGAGAASPEPQAAGAVTVESVRDVADLLGEQYPYLTTLSPDGARIAWGRQDGRGKDRVLQLCLFEFASAAETCSNLSPDAFEGYPYQFQWSPDGMHIAFSEDPVSMGLDSDIWLYSVVDGTFTDLTDDGVTGSWRTEASEGTQPVLDYLPMWNQADGLLYFWRIVPLGDQQFTSGLYRIPSGGGEPELVRDVSSAFSAQIPTIDYEHVYLDGAAAIAPDGSTVAVLMTELDDLGAAQYSLWAIDLADAAAAPRQLAGPDALLSGLPEWAMDFPPDAQGLAWTADSAGVVFVVNTLVGATAPIQVYYHVDAAGAAVTPVVDFSGLPEIEAYNEPAPGSDLPWRAYSPWAASLSPAGDKLLMINDLGGTVALFTAQLPPTGDLPAVSASSEESPMGGAVTASRSSDGKVLVYGLLMTVTEE